MDFLAANVACVSPDEGVSYADLEKAPAVLCVAFESEEESPIVFLRLRKAARERGTRVFHLGQFTTSSVRKTLGTLVRCVPGGEAAALEGLFFDTKTAETFEALSAKGSIILVGERAAGIPGLFSSVSRLAARTNAKVAWIPRRAGERGAVDSGATPTLLPGGRPVIDKTARAEVEKAWGLNIGALPEQIGKGTNEILAALLDGELSGLVVGGVDPYDLPDPVLAEKALSATGFVVSLEMRPSLVTNHANVVLPIAPVMEKSGSYVNWEGRHRPLHTTLDGTGALPDCRVLDTLAVEMGVDLFTQTPSAAATDLARLGVISATRRAEFSAIPAPIAPKSDDNIVVLATWRHLLDNGSLQEHEENLAGTARPAVARLSPGTAQRFGITEGALVTVATERGSVGLPAEFTDLPDNVVWLPTNSGPAQIYRHLGVPHGAVVSLRVGGNS